MTLNLTPPLEDELAVGFVGRLARLNGMSSIAWATKSIRSCFDKEEDMPMLWLVAQMCGLNGPEFAARHSMVPVLYPLSRYAVSGRETGNSRWLTKAYGLVASAVGVRWCPECARQDRRESGSAHWRRQHQINGLDWCVVHQVPLVDAPAGSAIWAPGHPATEGPTAMTPAQVWQELGHPALLRLQDILLSWLGRPQPLHLRAWGDVISHRCRDLDLRMGEIGKRAVASDLILERFPEGWLRRHMPEVASKQPCSFVRKIDGACIDRHVAYPALACAAILAVLFDSAEDALATLDSANQRIIAERQLQGTVDRALAAFKAGASLLEACKRFNVSLQDVETELRNAWPERRELEVA